MTSEIAPQLSVGMSPIVPIIPDYRCHALSESNNGLVNPETPAGNGIAEASVIFHAPNGSQWQGSVRTDPMMAVVLVVLVALGVLGMALYVLMVAIKAERR